MGTQRGALVEEKFVVGHHDNVQHLFWYTCYLEYLQVYCKCAKCVKSLPVKKSHTVAKVPFSKLEIWPGVPPILHMKRLSMRIFETRLVTKL